MNLELKHIAPYLPYGLKWTMQEMMTFVMTGITGETLYTERGTVLYWTKQPDLPQCLFPLLRPLSNLVNEIEHNGKRFIPIIELYKMTQEEKAFEPNEYKTVFVPEIIASFAHYLTKDLKHGFQFNYLLPQKSFTLLNSETRNQETISQLELFQKLFEWHFDVFELIDKGLAHKL